MSTDVQLLLAFVILSVVAAVVMVLRKAARVVRVAPDMARMMHDEGMDVPRAGQPAAEGDCPISLEPLVFPVTTSCGHVFSAHSLLEYWATVFAPRAMACPMCRTEVRELLESFRPGEWEPDRTEARRRVLGGMVRYNRTFSGRLTAWERVVDAGRELIRLVSSPEALLRAGAMLLASRIGLAVLLSLLGAVAYAMLPIDLLPESVLGVVGLLDDIAVGIAALLFAAGAVQAVVRRRMEAEAAVGV